MLRWQTILFAMKNTLQNIDRISTNRNNVGLAVLTLTVLLVPNVMLCFTEHLMPLTALVNLLIPAGLYSFFLFGFRNTGRTVLLMFPFMFFGAFQIVLLGLYGRSIIAVDMFLNVATTNSGEAVELLGNLTGVIALVCLLYLPPIVWAIVDISKGRCMLQPVIRRGRYVGLSLAIGGVIVALTASSAYGFSPALDLFPANAVHNLFLAIERDSKIRKYKETSLHFAYDARSLRSDTVRQLYVLVIGETSRAGSWRLAGYNRQTNPCLSKRKDHIVMFDHAMSESNTTHKSVPLMLSPLDSKDYEDKIYATKSIISAFREAGFTTAYISNQERNHGFIDAFGEEADTCLFIKDHPEKYDRSANDLVMNEPLNEIISNASGRQLIVVHTYGSHFNYRSRYSDEFRRFIPDNAVTLEASHRNALVNAYDNTLLVTDAFLDRLISSVQQFDGESLVLYAADHGEDIFDDSRSLFLHASPCPSYYQLHVPMFAWISDSYAGTHPEKVKGLLFNRHKSISTSASYFHTALDLAGISTQYLDISQSVASGIYKERPLAYLNDHNKKVDLSTAGFGPQDFSAMHRHAFNLKSGMRNISSDSY